MVTGFALYGQSNPGGFFFTAFGWIGPLLRRHAGRALRAPRGDLGLSHFHPDSVEFRAGLSPDSADRLDNLVEAATLQLRAWGHALERVAQDDLSPSIR